MQSNALTSTCTQRLPDACRKHLDSANATRAGLSLQSETTQPTTAANKKGDTCGNEKRHTCGYVHSEYASSSAERSDLHHHGIVGTSPRSSDHELSSAQT